MNIDVEIINLSNNILPQYETKGSVGMDIRAFITEKDSNVGSNSTIIVPSGSIKLIPTGIYVAIPVGYEIQVRPRSGLAYRSGITVLNTPGTIDSDYRGEIGIILYNSTSNGFRVNSGDRIAQLVLSKKPKINWKIVKKLSTTDRGQGGFGSSGVK